MLSSVLSFIGGFVSKLIAPFAAFWGGKKHEQLKNAEKVLDDVKKANAAASDDSHDDELSEKYNR